MWTRTRRGREADAFRDFRVAGIGASRFRPRPQLGGFGEAIGEARESTTTMSSSDSEVLAQQVSGLNAKVKSLEQRMADVEKVNARLEQAALTTARALQEISGHWDAVYEAMRRAETGDAQTSRNQ